MTGLLYLHPSTLFFLNSLWFIRMLKTCVRLCPSKSPDIHPSPNCSGGEQPCTTHQMLGPSRGRKLWWWDMDALEQEGNGMSIRSKEKSLGWKCRPHCPENLSTWGRKLYHWFNSPWTQSSSQLFFFSWMFFSSLLSFHKANPSVSVR